MDGSRRVRKVKGIPRVWQESPSALLLPHLTEHTCGEPMRNETQRRDGQNSCNTQFEGTVTT